MGFFLTNIPWGKPKRVWEIVTGLSPEKMNNLRVRVSNGYMKNTEPLKQGQLWKLKQYYVRIVKLAGDTVHFRMMDSPTDAGERILTSDLDILWQYLLSRKGHLVACGVL
jgi:hypothetical protein